MQLLTVYAFSMMQRFSMYRVEQRTWV